MSAYKDDKGEWYCKFRYKDWQGISRSTTKRGFKTKREALAYEASFKDEANSKPGITVSQLYEAYLEHEKVNRKPSTIPTVRNLLSKHVVSKLGSMKITDITPNTIRMWQNDLKAKDLKPASLKNINGYFSALLTFAVKYYNLPQNPFKVTGNIGHSEQRTLFWSLEEFNKVLAVAEENPKDIRYILMLKVLFYSGMRYGELMALTWNDIDFRDNTIRIIAGYMQNVYQIGDPKSQKRTVGMPPVLMNDIRKFKAMLYDDEEYPFRRKSEYFRKRLRKWAENAGVKYIHIHCLRHSHITYLFHKGFPAPAIAQRVGDTVETVLKIYTHSTKEDELSIVADLSKNVGQSVVKAKNQEP